ncbi:MAG: hypothetical protein BWX50_01416 [Euryarchaeota archaeon ADurb.Bin009]|nr:MAG: hypothetical protein BWX50_01416 [Euryarchaeota archaeon ADurb.Bin009]
MGSPVVTDDEDVAGSGDVDRLDGFCPVPGDGPDRHRTADRFHPAAEGDDAGHGSLPVHGVGDVRRRDGFKEPADGGIGALFLPRAYIGPVDGGPDPLRRRGHVGGLDDVSADDDDRGAGGNRLGCGRRVEPPRDGDGYIDLAGKAAEEVKRRPPYHLLVDADVGVDVIDAERRNLPRPGDGVVDVDEVGHDPDAVLPGRPDRLGDDGVVRIGKDADDAGAGLCRHLHLDSPGIGDLHVRDDLAAGEALPERPHGPHALALDQGGPGLYPVRTATNRFIRDLYRTIELEEIERHLENRCCHTVL